MRGSVVSFVRNNEVPHIATYETHQWSQEISFITQKRLLQQYPPGADIVTAGRHVSEWDGPAVLPPLTALRVCGGLEARGAHRHVP